MKRTFMALMVMGLLIAMAIPVMAVTTNQNDPTYWLSQYPNALSCYKSEGTTAHGYITQDKKHVILNPFQQS